MSQAALARIRRALGVDSTLDAVHRLEAALARLVIQVSALDAQARDNALSVAESKRELALLATRTDALARACTEASADALRANSRCDDHGSLLGAVTDRLDALKCQGDALGTQLNRAEAAATSLRQDLDTLIPALRRAADLPAIRERLRGLSRRVPKNESVVFVGRSYFGDNTKYAFLAYVAQATTQALPPAIFLTDDESQANALRAHALPVALWHASAPASLVERLLHARVAVFCDHVSLGHPGEGLPYALLDGATKVLLWHGTPIKKIALQNLPSVDHLNGQSASTLESTTEIDVFVGPARGLERIWRDAFLARRHAHLGYARNDVLLHEHSEAELVGVDRAAYDAARTASSDGRRIFMYAPTFRDGVGATWIESVDLERLGEVCAQLGAELYVNLHPYEQWYATKLRERRLRGVRVIDPATDVYPILRYVACVITDYSSVAFDYLVLDRPVVLFRPDHDEYVARSRQLIEDLLVQGFDEAATDVSALGAMLADLASIDSRQRAKRLALRARLMDHVDDRSSERIAALVASLARGKE